MERWVLVCCGRVDWAMGHCEESQSIPISQSFDLPTGSHTRSYWCWCWCWCSNGTRIRKKGD